MVALYARGITTRETQAHLKEIYKVEVSPSLISTVTDAVRWLLQRHGYRAPAQVREQLSRKAA